MESTEHPLSAQHLAGCLALSKSASWNQNEADWRLMLGHGRGWGISLADGTLIASTLVLPYGGRFAWISMVLVLPEHRRKGLATRLLRIAIADLENRGLTPVLDATPAGREVYLHEGFRDCWAFTRHVFSGAPLGGETRARPLRESDWKDILELDAAAFGASREPLLRALPHRLPEAALVVEGRGFVLGRDGREVRQLGPLVARDGKTARQLLAAALSRVGGPVYLDIADHADLDRAGFIAQRSWTRMVRGTDRAPGAEQDVFLVAGPELG
jgi:ribosomal protein S18 acetylase RimI-like enzyme